MDTGTGGTAFVLGREPCLNIRTASAESELLREGKKNEIAIKDFDSLMQNVQQWRINS